jgi:nicotinamide-nucleotide amidase
VVAGLRDRAWTIATAESCTAGLVAARIADVPGASAVLLGGLVTYANEAKESLAAVPAELIETHGAVSREVATALAEGARAALGADVGIGVTGVAGPGGGSAAKPVGLVHLAVRGPDGLERHLERRFPGARASVRDASTTAALHLARLLLDDARTR